MTHNCRKLEKYLFRGRTGCIFDPWIGGPGDSSYPEGSEYVWQSGVGGQKCLVTGGFCQNLISPFPIAGDWLKVAQNQALLTTYPPLPYIFWSLWTRGFTRIPCTWGKNAPRNALKQILIKFWAIMGHSVPFQTEEGSTGNEDFDRWVEFLRTFSRARLCCFLHIVWWHKCWHLMILLGFRQPFREFKKARGTQCSYQHYLTTQL